MTIGGKERGSARQQLVTVAVLFVMLAAVIGLVLAAPALMVTA